MLFALFLSTAFAISVQQRDPRAGSVANFKQAPTFPDRYFVQGLFEIPYFDTKETITAWTDKTTDMQKIEYYGGMDTYLYRYDHRKAFEIVPRINKKICFATNVTGPASVGGGKKKPRPQVLPLVPDISSWKYNGTHMIQGVQTNAYQTVVYNYTTYGTGVSTYTMYVDMNEKPVLLNMKGINFIMGSHPDIYNFWYHQFDSRNFSSSIFDVPQMCLQQNQANTELLARRSAHRLSFIHQRLGRVIPPMHTYMDCEHEMHPEFVSFTLQHKKRYSTCEEHADRQRKYFANKVFVESWNADETTTHTVELNHLADLDDEEYRQVILIPQRGEDRVAAAASAPRTVEPVDVAAMPSALDWRQKGAVTAVKDQGACGSCWTFGSTGALEGSHFLKHGKLISLSEQQITDCAWGYFGNAACDGGVAPGAYQYLMDVGGIGTEKSYHYLAQDGWCNNNDHSSGVQVASYANITGIPSMYNALSQGPVAIAIDAALPSFRFYKNGVYNDQKCLNGPNDLDHEVLAVGWGQDPNTGQKYWIVKNSWSTHWGNQGYINMAVAGNLCGVTTSATLPYAA